MSAEGPLPVNHPAMVAWERYKATEEFANVKRWAVDKRHTQGSLWAAFHAGWNATQQPATERAQPLDPRTPCLCSGHCVRGALAGDRYCKREREGTERGEVEAADAREARRAQLAAEVVEAAFRWHRGGSTARLYHACNALAALDATEPDRG